MSLTREAAIARLLVRIDNLGMTAAAAHAAGDTGTIAYLRTNLNAASDRLGELLKGES